MKTNILAVAAALSDHALLARVQALAVNERDAAVELVAHLAELDTRKAIYAAEGYGSLFKYCTEGLGLSEDAAYNRIEAARACRRFPVILDLLAAGDVTLTAVRMLARHLTADNHRDVLAEATRKAKPEIEVLVARLAPRPDVVSSIRRLPNAPSPTPPTAVPMMAALTTPHSEPAVATALPPPRPIVQATAPDRYRVQFTVDRETHDRLRYLQDLMRREIPDGDPGVIFARALVVLQEKVEKSKLAATTKPRRRTRSGTSPIVKVGGPPPRDTPADVQRVVWKRDGGRCAFVAASGNGARSVHSWSSITSGPTRRVARPPWRTPPCAAAATTSTRRNSSSVRTSPRACERRRPETWAGRRVVPERVRRPAPSDHART